MSKIYPETRDLCKTESEKCVYDALKEGLNEGYLVFCNVPSLRDGHDGEEDFIVLTPNGFLLSIEVKGGKRVCVENKEFYLVDWNDEKRWIKNPYEKTKNWIYYFVKSLKEEKHIIPHGYGYAVWFPFISRDSKMELTSLADEPKITLYKEDLKSTTASITRVEKYWIENNVHKNRINVNLKDLKTQLKNILAPSREFSACLSDRLQHVEHAIKQATDAQYSVLQILSMQNNALIKGCAGSGKTFLAMEQALRLSRLDKRSLIVCFNAGLSNFIGDIVREEGKGLIKTIHFHGLCREIIRASGGVIPVISQDEYDDTDLLEKTKNAITEKTLKYDAIFVDEGQDFKPNWWPILKSLLKENSKFFIFADDNQNVYRTTPQYPDGMNEYCLNENCRNTIKIFEKILKYHDRSENLTCKTKEKGEDIVYVQVESKDQYIQKVNKIIEYLMGQLKQNKVSILTPHSQKNSVWKEGTTFKINSKNPLKVHWGEWTSGAIECSSIRTFKGREQDAIILTELEDIKPEEEKEMLYVGISRAKVFLYIAGPKHVLDKIC